MHRGYSTITPGVVHNVARSVLERALGVVDFKRSVEAHQLLDLLLLIAATARTLFAVTRHYFGFSHETARQALRHNLPSPEVLTARLTDALHAVAAFTRRDRRRVWTGALDLHYVPYYGDRRTSGILGGPKKAGTAFFHCYATCVLIHKRRRYTVGLHHVEKGTKPHHVVRALLDQVAARGLVIGGVALDAGFDSGETILLLQRRRLSYVVPLRRKGSGANRRNDHYQQPHGTVTTMAWTTEKSRRAVSTRVLVWKHADASAPRVYAFGGWGKGSVLRRAWLGRRRYRERLGIETSYRQKNQARGWTTSTCPNYRLLLEGLALVLRQVWVCLTQQIARAHGLTPKAWVSLLPLVEMLEWLAQQIRDLYPHARRILLAQPTLTNNHAF
jgi:hypothetical protein